MPNLPEAYLARMKTQLGESGFAAYLRAMEEKPTRALRVNPLKTAPETFAALADFSLTPTEILPESFFFEDDVAIGRHPLHFRGALLCAREPAAQVPATLNRRSSGYACARPLCRTGGGRPPSLRR